MGNRILVIDDEIHILELLSYNLKKEGYDVITAETGEEGLEYLRKEKTDLLILDLMLPGMNGMEVLNQMREDEALRQIPVIMLTAKQDEKSKIEGLELGADDYLSKPFSIKELIARVRSLLRRISEIRGGLKNDEEEEQLVLDHMIVNKTRMIVIVNGKEVALPLKEFEVLYLLASNIGKVYSRDLLFEKIWGYQYFGETRTVDVHIRNLRKKIEIDPNEPRYIKTVRGVGYKFQMET